MEILAGLAYGTSMYWLRKELNRDFQERSLYIPFAKIF